MVKVRCIKCNREGSLTKKKTKSKGITYEYWYVEHHIGNKIKWCYLGKYEKLPEEYNRLLKDTQTDTQNVHKAKNPNLTSKSKTVAQSEGSPQNGIVSECLKNVRLLQLTDEASVAQLGRATAS